MGFNIHPHTTHHFKHELKYSLRVLVVLGWDQVWEDLGSPEAALSTGIPAHLFNRWQARDSPNRWAQESTHTSSPPEAPCELKAPFWTHFPPTVAGRWVLEPRNFGRVLLSSPECATQPGVGAGRREAGCGCESVRRSPPAALGKAPPSGENWLPRARSAPPALPRRCHSPHQPFHHQLCLHLRVSSHHQTDERKPRWRLFQA